MKVKGKALFHKMMTIAGMIYRKIDGQKLKQNFSLKVTNVARTAHEGKINSIPTSLRNKTTEWVKKKLEDIADYIEDYSYKIIHFRLDLK